MMQWLFGAGADKKGLSRQVKKASRWVEDGQGGYVNLSTTASSLQSLANNLNPVSDAKSNLAADVMSAFGETSKTLSDDGDVIEGSSLDALGLYQEELKRT